jgi:hypothetical protein
MQAIPFLQNQQVRDLAWACFGHNLINDFSTFNNDDSVSSCQIPLTEKRRQWLLALDQAPTSLQSYLQQTRSPRLGIYFETLWQYFIARDEQLSLIAHNLQIEKNKKTLGEFDLIYQDLLNGDYVHLELAIKFYLNCSTSMADKQTGFDASLQYWLGPNQIDRLDKKLARLLDHQILLADNSEAKQALKQLGADKLQKSIALKGTLFYPNVLSSQRLFDAADNTANRTLAPDHQQGRWLHYQHFPAISSQAGYWKKLPRAHWISPAYHSPTDDAKNLLKPQQIVSWLSGYFSRYWQPLMVCAMSEYHNGYREQQRYFITGDNWPAGKPTDKWYSPSPNA